jgi:hypothetical protein
MYLDGEEGHRVEKIELEAVIVGVWPLRLPEWWEQQPEEEAAFVGYVMDVGCSSPAQGRSER